MFINENVSHNSRTCRAPKCSINGCGKRHHNLVHISPDKDESGQNKPDVETLSGFMFSRVGQQHLLPTAWARLVYNDKECPVRVLFDSGSQETFLRSSVADDMGIKKDQIHFRRR